MTQEEKEAHYRKSPSTRHNEPGKLGDYLYDVRLHDYATAKKFYEQTKPLGGARKKFGNDVRPMTDRYRKDEVWFKEGDNYGVATGWSNTHWQPTPLPKNATPEQVAKHRHHKISGYTNNYKKLIMFRPDGVLEFTPSSLMDNFVTWDVLGATLPKGIEFVRYGSKRYMKVDCPSGEVMHYRVWDGCEMNFIPYEKDGVRYFAPDKVIGEKKFMVDREKAKKAREDLEAFLNYAKFMMDLLTINHKDWSRKYGAEAWLANKKTAGYYASSNFDEHVDSGWLNRKEGEDIGEHWIQGVEALCLCLHRTDYDRMKDKYFEVPATFEDIQEYVKKADRLYKFARPYNEVEVPVGKPFYSNGRDL
jgi:hypothetical protein